ncbi:hypothetical protein ACU610_26365 [Geodermatophilus sp. URMC 61]|uniref:hypothetical protein n=1 Tax=Geodermatophilus sp. URMC 61 TaxID=3423411 RepID=UPI00406C0698
MGSDHEGLYDDVDELREKLTDVLGNADRRQQGGRRLSDRARLLASPDGVATRVEQAVLDHRSRDRRLS